MSISSAVNQTDDLDQRFDRLFETHYDAIFRYCVRRLGIAEAEDGAADVFAVAWRRITDVPSGDKTRAWLFGVAHRVVGNRYRSRRRWSRLQARVSAAAERGEPELAGDDQSLALLEALSQLRPNDQELLRLSTWDRLSRSEIAQVLGITENAVDQRLHRARSRLKTRYERLARPSHHSGSEETS